MPLVWLRVATFCYGLGLVYALLLLAKRGEQLGRIALPMAGLGMVFHFVSLVEMANEYGYVDLLTIRHAQSVLALLLVAIFFALYARYHTASQGLFIFPLAFVLTFGSAMALRPPQFGSPMIRSGWIFVHVSLLLIGYAALFLSFMASLLYLIQQRSLKSKQPSGIVTRMPALQVVDDLGYRSLVFGFPFMTVGLIIGSAVAQQKYGPAYFTDPKVLASILMWGVYMVLLYTRWNAGWRGRRAAYLGTFAVLAAVCAWAANYFSPVHRFVAP